MTGLLKQGNLLKPLEEARLSKHLQEKLSLPPVVSVKKLWELPVASLTQYKILEALKLEPFLTIAQVASLFYAVKRDGQPAKSTRFRPRPTAEYELVPGYHSARAQLNRMADTIVRDKKRNPVLDPKGREVSRKPLIIKHVARKQEDPNWYSLPGAVRPFNDQNRDHEIDCADMFVALKKTGKLDHWQKYWSKDEHALFLKRFHVEYDRRFELEDCEQVFFLEVDRGSESPDQIKKKIQDYTRMSVAYPQERFTVLFTVQGYIRDNNDDILRFNKLMPILANAKRGNQFLMAIHSEAVSDPLGNIWHSPWTEGNSLDPDHISLLDL